MTCALTSQRDKVCSSRLENLQRRSRSDRLALHIEPRDAGAGALRRIRRSVEPSDRRPVGRTLPTAVGLPSVDGSASRAPVP